MTHHDAALLAALADATEDLIVFDLDGIEARHESLLEELPGVDVRFAMKACPLDEVISCLALKGAGVDAASPDEIAQAIAAGVPPERIHYGNPVKSDRNIADAHRLGVRDYATDSTEDVAAIALHAPGVRVFCRLATDGYGALWGLSDKFGCSAGDAVRVLRAARDAGLIPSGLSVHVGSQQMTTEAWQRAFDDLTDVLEVLAGHGIALDHVNLGGGLPALGYLDRHGEPFAPSLDKMFAAMREGMERCAQVPGHRLRFVVEPGRHLVADHGAVRAHVARLSTRTGADGEPRRWLYLSAGKFNGLYEMDDVRYPLVFPTRPSGPLVPVTVAGPTCDSADTQAPGHVLVPEGLASGDPVWVLSSGAYAISYQSRGFNGIKPLPHICVRGEGG
ncbi:type III PLP-dependent enzyme [Actinacidiphila acidipaludis]|uniref:ornithine decarboxylase n=1 Tax=Actinacidiphila acidipaludis TaxID=2873382 RepID=A0ABS7QE50_9ACTN|nr:type III PLP-dependent enzyme [Streptomyces acidipaludis]MBY8881455.1 type III PLP-dependent enzyme [Streptomyces acidipaludis]